MAIQLLHPQSPFPRRWQQYRRPLAFNGSQQWHSWLYDKGSLTRRLMQANAGDLRVQVVHNRWGYPSHTEMLAMGMKPRQIAIIREVNLLCCQQVWVCARSMIPASTLKGRQRCLKNIGNKALGTMLFAHRNMQRGAIQITQIIQANSQQMHWARRSVFYLDQRPLLVTEVFMPPIATPMVALPQL